MTISKSIILFGCCETLSKIGLNVPNVEKLEVYVWFEKINHWLEMTTTPCTETPTDEKLHLIKQILKSFWLDFFVGWI